MIEHCPASSFKNYLPSDYRKKRVVVSRNVEPGPAHVNSYWDGGSIRYYTLYRDGKVTPVSRYPGFPRFVNQTIELLPGDVLVETGFFSGKTATARITFIQSETDAKKGPGNSPVN